jgi:hypothetical protein
VGGSPDLRQLARKDAKYRYFFLLKMPIHTSNQQRPIDGVSILPIYTANIGVPHLLAICCKSKIRKFVGWVED